MVIPCLPSARRDCFPGHSKMRRRQSTARFRTVLIGWIDGRAADGWIPSGMRRSQPP